MRTASFPRDQPRSTFPHLKCQLHLFLAFHLFPTFNQLLASSPASCRNAFLSLFFFSWELWILIPLKGFYEDISFFFSRRSCSVGSENRNWIISNYCFLNLDFMNRLDLSFERMDTSYDKERRIFRFKEFI